MAQLAGFPSAERSQSLGYSSPIGGTRPIRKVVQQERIDPTSGASLRQVGGSQAGAFSEAERLGMSKGGAEISNISAPHAQTNERLTQNTHDSVHDMTMTLKEVNSQQLG